MIKLWRIVKQLGDNEQIGYLQEAQSAAGSTRPDHMSLEVQDSSQNIKLSDGNPDEVSRSIDLQKQKQQQQLSITQMIVLDLALYHSFLAIVALTMVTVTLESAN